VAIINETVLYKSRLGIMAYSGGIPQLISENFGTDKYYQAVAGTDGTKYYLSALCNGDPELLVYDMEKGRGKDPYELFLSGNQAMVRITNPANTEGKRLIIFRDSFGSSITPLPAQGYSEVLLLDLRYVSSAFVGKLANFRNADVLFMYSTLLLNNSTGMK
jgi:hypothetical protein